MEFVLTNAQSNTCHARKRLSRLDERNKYTGKVEKLNMNTYKNKIACYCKRVRSLYQVIHDLVFSVIK